MNKICFLYTETNGLHKTNKNVYKKNLYDYARMVLLNYEIGTINKKEYTTELKCKRIVKPRCMNIGDTDKIHNITQEKAEKKGVDPELIIEELKDNLIDVNIIVAHNVDFHLKTILAEAVRYNIQLEFKNFVIIDTISFFHDYGFINLMDLAKKLKIKNIEDMKKIELIKNVFFKLYSNYKKSIKIS